MFNFAQGTNTFPRFLSRLPRPMCSVSYKLTLTHCWSHPQKPCQGTICPKERKMVAQTTQAPSAVVQNLGCKKRVLPGKTCKDSKAQLSQTPRGRGSDTQSSERPRQLFSPSMNCVALDKSLHHQFGRLSSSQRGDGHLHELKTYAQPERSAWHRGHGPQPSEKVN